MSEEQQPRLLLALLDNAIDVSTHEVHTEGVVVQWLQARSHHHRLDGTVQGHGDERHLGACQENRLQSQFVFQYAALFTFEQARECSGIMASSIGSKFSVDQLSDIRLEVTEVPKTPQSSLMHRDIMCLC
jgi:hypothetical protein